MPSHLAGARLLKTWQFLLGGWLSSLVEKVGVKVEWRILRGSRPPCVSAALPCLRCHPAAASNTWACAGGCVLRVAHTSVTPLHRLARFVTFHRARYIPKASTKDKNNHNFKFTYLHQNKSKTAETSPIDVTLQKESTPICFDIA